MTGDQEERCPLNKYQCRRKFQIEAHDERPIIKNVTTIDPSKKYLLFPECKECKLGKKTTVLKTRTAPFETYEIRGCTIRMVSA